MATHANILAWKIPWAEEPDHLYIVHGDVKELDMTEQIFLPAILIPACASSSPAFLMMYSAYK